MQPKESKKHKVSHNILGIKYGVNQQGKGILTIATR